MPYQIKKIKGGYVVVNLLTGKHYSNHPMTKEKAEAQLRLLRMVT
jgi:hypothetical protein